MQIRNFYNGQINGRAIIKAFLDFIRKLLEQMISYKWYLECTLIQWRLYISIPISAQVAVGTFFMKSPIYK